MHKFIAGAQPHKNAIHPSTSNLMGAIGPSHNISPSTQIISK